MSTQEINVRLIVIDNAMVLLLANGNREILDDKRAAMRSVRSIVARFLGLDKEPVLVPDRSFELATTSDDKVPTGIALQLLSTLADYKDPLTSAALQQLLNTLNQNTLSSRLSFLKSHGLVSANGVPSQYMVTGKGHAALVAAKAHEAHESAKGDL